MDRELYFFTHIMKTAGTTLTGTAAHNLGWESMGPIVGLDYLARDGLISQMTANRLAILIKFEPELLRLCRHGRRRFFSGHMPYAARAALDGAVNPLRTMTVLRNPVERVCSHLLQEGRNAREAGVLKPGQGMESLYDHPEADRVVCDYQVKHFAMNVAETFAPADASPQWQDFMALVAQALDLVAQAFEASAREQREKALSELLACLEGANQGGSAFESYDYGAMNRQPHGTRIDIDSARFSAACDALEEHEVVGLTEQLDEMHEQLCHWFSWQYEYQPGVANRGEKLRISTPLRKRIARDNEADMAFYHYARRLVSRRRRQRLRSHHFV